MFLAVALKVCETCGSLWYRPETTTSNYCARCVDILKDFPTPESRKMRGRPGRKKSINLSVVYASAEVHDAL